MIGPSRNHARRSLRLGYTLLEMFLVLVITGVLLAAIGSALHIHLRVAEVGRTEVEQAQLARALLRRIADDLRGAVPHIEPVASTAGATSDSIASAAASAASALGGTGAAGGTTGGGTSGGGTSGGAAGSSSRTASSGGASSGGSSSGGGTSSGGSGGTQTLQPLGKLGTLGTLSALKPQSASSASGGTSGNSSGGASQGASGGGSSGGSSGGKSGSGTDSASDTSEETSTTKPPGIYGDQYSLQIDVSRLPRAGASLAAPHDAPGDVKTVGYYLAPITGATDATGSQSMGLYRQSFDKAIANYGAASGGAGSTSEPQLLAAEVAAIQFQYYDGTTWMPSWDSSAGGALPTAVEILITLHTPPAAATMSSHTLEQPQVYRLTVAIPAAATAGSSTSTGTDSESSSSAANSSSSGATK